MLARVSTYRKVIASAQAVHFALEHSDDLVAILGALDSEDTQELHQVAVQILVDFSVESLAANQDQVFEFFASTLSDEDAADLRAAKQLYDQTSELYDDYQQFMRIITHPHEVLIELVIEHIKEETGWNDFIASTYKFDRHAAALELALIAQDREQIADASEKVALEFEHMMVASHRLDRTLRHFRTFGGYTYNYKLILNKLVDGLGNEVEHTLEVLNRQFRLDANQLIQLSQACGPSWCGSVDHLPWAATEAVAEQWPLARCEIHRRSVPRRCYRAPAYVNSRRDQMVRTYGCPGTYSRCCLPASHTQSTQE